MEQAVVVQVDEPDADPERLEQLALALREELLGTDADVDVSQFRAGAAPAGTRALDIAAIGALLVSVKLSTESVGAVVRTIRGWLGRAGGTGRSVTLTVGDRTLVLESATAEQQEQLVREFLHSLPRD